MEKQYRLIKRNYASGKIEYVIQSNARFEIDRRDLYVYDNLKEAEEELIRLTDKVIDEEEIIVSLSSNITVNVEEPEDEFVIPNKENLRKQFESESGKKSPFEEGIIAELPLYKYYSDYSEWLEKQLIKK